VLKAIGARNGYLYRVVVQLALVIGVAGFVLGLGLTWATARLVEYLTPELGVETRTPFVVRTLAVALGLSLLSAVLPVRRIAGLDPLRVFRR
jgi:putative ABC transport system permease protein